MILGNNGFVWLYPTPEQLDEGAGGFYTNLQVGTGHIFMGSLVNILLNTHFDLNEGVNG